MTESLRVLVVDDHEIVRDGLRLILDSEDGFEVVGEAADGAEAVAKVAELTPDVVLMDVRMPKMDGLQALSRLQNEHAQVAVVVLTTYDEDQLVRDALQAGARGYLLKDTGREQLFRTVRAAARGDTLLTTDVMKRALTQPSTSGKRPRAHPGGLTSREREILEAITRGDRSREIAEQFGITERTVKAHLASVYTKLGVQSRAGAVARAIRDGLVSETGS